MMTHDTASPVAGESRAGRTLVLSADFLCRRTSDWRGAQLAVNIQLMKDALSLPQGDDPVLRVEDTQGRKPEIKGGFG